VNLSIGYREDTPEKTARFVNGLRLEILDEISILSLRNIEEAYESALKAEEKLTRKHNSRRGRGTGKGKGQCFGKGRTTNKSEEGSSSKTSRTVEKDGSTRGGRPYQRGRGNGRGRGATYQCYKCHKRGHKSFEFPEEEQVGQRGTYVAQIEEAKEPPQEVENALKIGEALVLNKVFL